MEAGPKLRVYLDTSIPNHLFVDDRPDWMEWTWKLWERLIDGECEVFLSPVFFLEINRCPDPKLSKMYEQLGRVRFMRLEESEEVSDLADEYIRRGVLPATKRNDCLHIAYAVAGGCDVVLSWNFEDIVTDRTRDRVKVVNAVGRYNEIGIMSPDEFLEGGRR
jgi:predicted nucleic acid-binding protein